MASKLLSSRQTAPYRPRTHEGPTDPALLAEEATRQGYEDGLAQGRAAAQQELDQQLAEQGRRLAETLKALATLREGLVEETRAETLTLALTAATRLLRARIEGGDPVIARVLEETLEQTRDPHACAVELHPEDLEIVRNHGVVVSNELELRPNPRIGRGGCIVCTKQEEIDARIETALAALLDAGRQGGA